MVRSAPAVLLLTLLSGSNLTSGLPYARTAEPCPKSASPDCPLPLVPRAPLDFGPEEDVRPGGPAPLGSPPEIYRGLTPRDALCLAGWNSAKANRLDREREAIASSAGHKHKKQCSDELRQAMLFHTATETRNRDAANAMEMYFRLLEAEAKADLARQGLANMADVLARGRDVQKRGLKLPFDYEQLVRDEIDLKAKQVRLAHIIERLNGSLDEALGLPMCEELIPLWPVGRFAIDPHVPCESEAVALALARRPELLMLRQIEHDLDARSLPAVKQLLQGSDSLTGTSGPRCPMVAAALAHMGCGNSDEVELRRQQVHDLLIERERAVTREVREAVRALAAATRLVDLAKAKLRSLHDRVRELEGKEEQGMGSLKDLTAAKLDWFQGRGDLANEIASWHIALVKLKLAQGVLQDDCEKSCHPETCVPTGG